MKLEVVSREPKQDVRPTPVLFVHGAWHGAWCWTEYFLPYFAQNGYHSYALSLKSCAIVTLAAMIVRAKD